MVMVELQEAVKRGAKFIELRLDFLARSVDLKRIAASKQCPLVATLRRTTDGGRWPGTEEQRQMLIRQVIVSGVFDWIDLEYDIASKVPRFGPVKRIVSYHNMQETPENLEDIFEAMCKLDADVLKIAVTAQTPEDQLRVLKIIKDSPKPTVGHCMGEFGIASRFLALKYGAPFIYAAFNKERGIAPGLPSLDEARHTFAVDRINADTKVFGVVGDPVSHSLSPMLHNRLFREHDVNAVYLPFRVPRGTFPTFVNHFQSIPVDGYSVTIPHKEPAATLATEAEVSVTECHAANTLVRKEDGWFGANTDYDAARTAITEALPDEAGSKGRLTGKHVLILGAGGVSRAIAHALHRTGAVIAITSRTMDKSTKLAAEVGCKAVEWMARHNGHCDILINGTPVGMHPNVDDCPIHSSFLKPGMVVFDTIYTPENTLLIKNARERECIVVTGIEMFVLQAAAQFRLFTGIEPNINELRDTMRRIISPDMHSDDDDRPNDE